MTDAPAGTRRQPGTLLRLGEPVTVAVYIGVALAVCALLALPVEARDVVFLAGALLWLMIAMVDFAGAWISFILILPFVHVLGSMFGIRQLTFVRMVLIGLMCAFPFSRTGQKLPRAIGRDLGFVAFLLFTVANLASGVRLLNTAAILRGLSYCEPLLFYVLTYCVVRRYPPHFRKVLRAVAIGGVVVAALGVVEMATQQSVFGMLRISLPGLLEDPRIYLEEDRFGLGGRIISTIGQPVYASLYFAMWLIATVYYLLAYESRRWRGLLLIVVPLGLTVIAATGSRGPLLAVVPAILTVALLGRRQPNVWLTIVAAAVTVVVLFLLFVPQLLPYLQASTAVDIWTPENANVLGRVEVTNRLLDSFRLSPIWGNGPGVIQHAALEGDLDFAGLGGQENQYAVVLADGGMIAGASYLFFMVAALRSVLKAASSTTRALRGAGLMTFALFVFYFAATSTVTCLTQIPSYLLMTAYGGVVALTDTNSVAVPPPPAPF